MQACRCLVYASYRAKDQLFIANTAVDKWQNIPGREWTSQNETMALIPIYTVANHVRAARGRSHASIA